MAILKDTSLITSLRRAKFLPILVTKEIFKTYF